tara:strand:+ start:146 stop:331 length:186 start_codon:yes stop_codon:yes gene_type:complete
MLVRFITSGATAGFCNPCVSIAEDLIVFPLCVLAILLAFMAVAIGVVVLIATSVTVITKVR